MINKNIKKIILLVSLCFLLIGFVSATSTNDTISKTNNILKENKNTDTNIVTKTNNINKNINKEVKTATKKNKTKISLTLNQSKAVLNDKIKITATLKDNKNKAIKNQNITVKIGTKTYTRVTNTNGKIVLNYKITNNNVLGKNITATYKGNKVYSSSKATKLLQSNEAAIYNKKLKQIAGYVDKLNKSKVAFEKTFETFDVKSKTHNVFESTIKLLDKTIDISNDLNKYLTSNNRKTFNALIKKGLTTSKAMGVNYQNVFKQTKLFLEGKISEKTFDSRITAIGKKIDQNEKTLINIESQLKKLYVKSPYLIKGVEKYFID